LKLREFLLLPHLFLNHRQGPLKNQGFLKFEKVFVLSLCLQDRLKMKILDKIFKLTKQAFFVWGKMPIPLKRPFPQPTPFILINLVYYITFNLKISASRQNIKNLISNFGAIYVGIMHDKFQASSFTGVGGE